MNIFLREMRRSIKALLLWCFGIAALLAAGMGKYAGMHTAADALNAYWAILPAPMRALFGIGSFDLSTALGFYGVMFAFLLLTAGVHASMLGAGALVREEQERTAEFLLVKPVSRSRVMAAKYLAAWVQTVILNLVTWAVSALALAPYYPDGAHAASLIRLIGGLMLFQWVFLAVGAAMGAVIRKPERAAAAASGVLMSAFLLTMLAGLDEALDFLNLISPFGLFSARHTLTGNGLPGWSWAYTVLVCGGATALAFRIYPRKDILI